MNQSNLLVNVTGSPRTPGGMDEIRMYSSLIFTGTINVRTKEIFKVIFEILLQEIRTIALSIE